LVAPAVVPLLKVVQLVLWGLLAGRLVCMVLVVVLVDRLLPTMPATLAAMAASQQGVLLLPLAVRQVTILVDRPLLISTTIRGVVAVAAVRRLRLPAVRVVRALREVVAAVAALVMR
jgi:hypothetical protein